MVLRSCGNPEGIRVDGVQGLLAGAAREFSGRPAVAVGPDIQITFAELWEEAASRSIQLAAGGAGQGERVAILLPRGIDALAFFFGAQMLGAVTIFVDDKLKRSQVAHLLSDSKACVVATNSRLRHLLPPTWPAHAVLDASSPPLRSATAPVSMPSADDQLAALMYTSGSTGPPKGVMVTQANLVSGARIVAGYLGLTLQDRTLAVLPWSFDYGLNQVLATFSVGGCVVIQSSAFAPDLCRALAEGKITGLAGVPPLWELLTRRPSSFLTMKLPHLRYLTNSGGTLNPRFITSVARSHPHVAIYAMYGLTEAFRSTYLPPSLLGAKPTSIGQAIPETEIMVLDSAGQRCGVGQVGELVHNGPTAAVGYWRHPGATARVFRPHPFPAPDAKPATVVYSGDYVRQDAEGFLYFVGRRDQMFKSLGIRTNPGEIEAAMLACAMVSEVVVHNLPAQTGQPCIAAVVVPVGDAGEPESWLPLLRAYCEAELPAHLRPHHYVVTRDLPRTVSGKADRAAIREQLLATGLSRAAL